jgi:hypothetical protein
MKLSRTPMPTDWAVHTPTSDPGRYAALLAAVPPQPLDIGGVDRNVIAHYRAQAADLPANTRGDINLRWLSDQLATDQRRHPQPLHVERPVEERLQGCCRDHTLFAVAILRQHGFPARSRVGFASYFDPEWRFDHVVAEYWADTRWRRFDPELDPSRGMLPDPTDLQLGAEAPFQTAAEVYSRMESGELDPTRYGVEPGSPFRGEQFVVGEVFYEVAHRYGDEVLLWDGWGAIPPMEHAVPADVRALVSEISTLLLAADAGDLGAEVQLYDRYRSDPRLHPGDEVTQFSPFGDPPVQVALRR